VSWGNHFNKKTPAKYKIKVWGLGLWCLAPLWTIFQLYRGYKTIKYKMSMIRSHEPHSALLHFVSDHMNPTPHVYSSYKITWTPLYTFTVRIRSHEPHSARLQFVFDHMNPILHPYSSYSMLHSCTVPYAFSKTNIDLTLFPFHL
jgi:hypothetical protein